MKLQFYQICQFVVFFFFQLSSGGILLGARQRHPGSLQEQQHTLEFEKGATPTREDGGVRELST